MRSVILFLCPHNAAKSIMAAAYFNQQAAASGLTWTAVSAGTEPSDHISPAVVHLLRSQGMDVSQQQPRRVTSNDLETATRVISLGCATESLPVTVGIEHWHDLPLPSQDLHRAYDVIHQHVTQLLVQLKNLP